MAQPACALVIDCPLIEPLGVVRDLWRDYSLKPLRHVIEINAIAAGKSNESADPAAVTHSELKDFAHLALGLGHSLYRNIESPGVSQFVEIRASAVVISAECL